MKTVTVFIEPDTPRDKHAKRSSLKIGVELTLLIKQPFLEHKRILFVGIPQVLYESRKYSTIIPFKLDT